MEFIPLSSLNISDEEAAMLYYELRTALERMFPNNMVDACDYEVLTVFPFKRGECSNAPDDYEVENYEVGMYGTQPALCKMGEDCETILVLDEELGVLANSPCPISAQSPSQPKRTQPRPIRKMQEVSRE